MSFFRNLSNVALLSLAMTCSMTCGKPEDKKFNGI